MNSKYLSLAFLLLAWLVPLHFLPWVSWHSDALAFLAVLALAWGIAANSIFHKKLIDVSVPSVALPFLALMVVAIVQFAAGVMTFSGDVLVIGFFVSLCIISLTIGYGISIRATEQPARLQHQSAPALIAWAMISGGLASSTVAFAQVFEVWSHSEWIVRMSTLRRPGANLAQPNHLASLLVMAVASLYFLYELKKISPAFFALVLFIFCLSLAATESRAGALSFALLLGWWLVKRPAIARGTSSLWAGALAGGFAVLFLTWPIVFNSIYLYGDYEGARLKLYDLRFEMWRQMLEAVALRPWAGWGIREVAEAHNHVVDRFSVSLAFTYSHNFLIDLMVWVGIPVAVLIVVPSAIWSWRRTKMINQLLPWYCVAVALPLVAHSQLEFPFAYAYFLVPVMFLLGCMEANLGIKPMFRMKFSLATSLLLLVSCLLVWASVEYLKAEEDFRVARFEVLRIGKTSTEHQRPKIILLTQLGALLEGARLVPQRNMAPDEITLLGNVAFHFPWRAPQYTYALALALNGNPTEASRQIQVMRRQHGELFYTDIKKELKTLASTKYLELGELILP